MPFYKKRRRAPAGPNKNEKKVMRGQADARIARTAGVLGQRFPSLQALTIQLDFITPQQQLMDQQSRAYGPEDVCDFQAACPGRCNGQGSFDLAGKIESTINSRQENAQAAGTCQEPLYPGSPERCGMQLRCRIEAAYND